MQKAIIDFSENAALGAYANSKQPDDECSITLKGNFVSSSGGKMELRITELEYENDGETESIEPDIDEPIALSVMDVSPVEEKNSKAGKKKITEELLYGGDEEEDEEI